MAEWRLTQRADADILAIYNYTHRRFGAHQAEAYAEGLGNSADDIKAGTRRFRFQSHLVFFTVEPNLVVVRAIIHARRNLRHELFD